MLKWCVHMDDLGVLLGNRLKKTRMEYIDLLSKRTDLPPQFHSLVGSPDYPTGGL